MIFTLLTSALLDSACIDNNGGYGWDCFWFLVCGYLSQQRDNFFDRKLKAARQQTTEVKTHRTLFKWSVDESMSNDLLCCVYQSLYHFLYLLWKTQHTTNYIKPVKVVHFFWETSGSDGVARLSLQQPWCCWSRLSSQKIECVKFLHLVAIEGQRTGSALEFLKSPTSFFF